MRRLPPWLRATITVAILLVSSASLAAVVEVDTCGQLVRGGKGVLVADLDCAGRNLPALTIERGKLDMNGFTISGSSPWPALVCLGRCKIVGPGTVTGGGNGIDGKGRLTLVQVDVVGNDFLGVSCFTSCSIRGPASIRDNGHGPTAPELYQHGVLTPATAKVRDVVISGNRGAGVVARNPLDRGRVVLRNATVTDNQFAAIAGRSITVVDSVLTHNWGGGLLLGEDGCAQARRLSVKNTVLIDNGFGPGCGISETCVDLMSCRVPQVKGTTLCERSYVLGSGFPGEHWDVCDLD
jgi:hypothetical protein